MNKLFLILSALAIATSVYAQIEEDDYSELALIPTDDLELKWVKPEYQVLSDYCLESRDDVKKFLTDSANAAAASIFQVFFQSAQELSEDVLKVQHDAVAETTQMIKDNVAIEPIPAGASKEEVKEIINENTQKVSLIGNVRGAIASVLNTVIETAKTEFMARLAVLKSRFTNQELKKQITDVCASVSYKLKKDISGKLEAAKEDAKRSAAKLPNGQSLMAVLSGAQIETVGCLTSGRVFKVSKACDILNLVGPTLFPLIGLN